MLSWVREKIAESRLRWQQHSCQADERDSASPPPLPPPDFDESPASVPMASDFTDFTPFANGTLSAPSDTQMIGVPPSTELTLPLKSHFSSSAAQQKKSERIETMQQTWSSGYESAQCLKNRIRVPSVRHVTLRVFNTDGSKCTVNAPVTLTGADVKQRALAEFRSTHQLPLAIQRIVGCSRTCDSDQSGNNQELELLSKMHKITRITNIHERFDETTPLLTANIQNYEELLLILSADYCDAVMDVQPPAKARVEAATVSLNRFSDNNGDYIHDTGQSANQMTPPTHEDIEMATRFMANPDSTATNNVINVYEFVSQNDVQHDVRRILVSLSNSCARVIGAGPYSSRILHMLKQKLIRQRRFEYDTQQYLVDMGFAHCNVQHALHMCNNVCATALEWLIEHPSPVDLVDGSGDAPDVSVSTKCAINANTTNNIESLLEIIRIYGQRNSPPSAEAIQLFIDMGFEEALAREALRVVGNHHSLACEWLVGNRSKVAFDRSDGSPFDLHVLKILLDSPHIQLGLSSPKIFFAFLSILEDYAAMGMWLNDNETANIIGEILRTYHGEKHISAINHFRDCI